MLVVIRIDSRWREALETMLVAGKCKTWEARIGVYFNWQRVAEEEFNYRKVIELTFERFRVSCVLRTCIQNCYHVTQTPPLRGLGSGGRGTCVFAGPGLRVLPCAFSDQFATMSASGCPCLELRAAPFVCRLIASQLALAISFRFGARTPCCGHGLDHRRRQSRRRSGKLEQLNNQVHGRITSFPRRRRYQHTGLTPLILRDCTINIRRNVPKYKVNSSRKSERRAA